MFKRTLKLLFFTSTSMAYLYSIPAHAHLGHLGELAGHSHWIGVGAVIVAGAIAAVAGKLIDDSRDKDVEEDVSDAEQEAEVA